MFRDGCIVCGASTMKANILYAAVYLFGPTWTEGPDMMKTIKNDVPNDTLKQQFKECRDWIEKANPNVDEIDAWMQHAEHEMRAGRSPMSPWAMPKQASKSK